MRHALRQAVLLSSRAPVVLVSDTFTEAVDTELSLHVPQVGGGWAQSFGNAQTASCEAGTNKLKGGSTSTTANYRSATAGPTSGNYAVEADISLTSTSSGTANPGLAAWVRGSTAVTKYEFTYNAGNVSLVRILSNSSTSLASSSVASLTINTPITARLEVRKEGSNVRIKVMWGGVEIINYLDTTPLTDTGHPGLRLRANGRIANYKVFSL